MLRLLGHPGGDVNRVRHTESDGWDRDETGATEVEVPSTSNPIHKADVCVRPQLDPARQLPHVGL